jgi:hypothetical protein
VLASPPWGAVEDSGVSQRRGAGQISLIAAWVESGTLHGNNPNVLPVAPTFGAATPQPSPSHGITVRGERRLDARLCWTG